MLDTGDSPCVCSSYIDNLNCAEASILIASCSIFGDRYRYSRRNMANQQHPKARLVKCPKCARILPEPKHVPLYTCGGCGTILQGNRSSLVQERAEF